MRFSASPELLPGRRKISINEARRPRLLSSELAPTSESKCTYIEDFPNLFDLGDAVNESLHHLLFEWDAGGDLRYERLLCR